MSKRDVVQLRVLVFLFLLTAAAPLRGTSSEQQASNTQSYTVGILPFSDLSGNTDLGQLASVLPGMMQNSLLQRSSLVPRQIQSAANGASPTTGAPSTNQPIDIPTAAQIGQYNGTSVVLSGTLLSGQVSTKQGSFTGGSVGGIQIGGNSTRQSSTVTIQIVLVDAGKGAPLGTFRATGKDTETHIDPNANTNYGNMNMQSGEFQNTSLAKAVQKALDDLTKQITAALKGFTPSVASAETGQQIQSQASQQNPQQQMQAPAPAQSQVLVYGNKNLFGTQYPSGVDPTAGAQLGNLIPAQISTASQTYYYTHAPEPGFGNMGAPPDYPGTHQLYVGSQSTPSDSTVQRGPQTISMDYSSLVPAGQLVSGLTLGMEVTGFDAQDTGETYTAQINGQVNLPLSHQLNSFRSGGQETQFFSIGVDPKLLSSNNHLTLQIDATDPKGWNKPWAFDFLTISVATAPPSAPTAAAASGAASSNSSYSSATPQNGSGIALPSATQVDAGYQDGSKASFKPQEQVAFVFLDSINTLEHSACLRVLQRPCSLDELVNGVTANGLTFGLTQDPRQDTNYRYTLQTLGSSYEVTAVPQRPGFGGFLLDSSAGLAVADFHFNPSGAASMTNKKFSEFGFSGDGFVRQ